MSGYISHSWIYKDLSQTGKGKCFSHTCEHPVFISCSLECQSTRTNQMCSECHVAASKNTEQAVSLSLALKKKISRIVSAALECSGTFSDVLKEIGTKTREQKIFSVV